MAKLLIVTSIFSIMISPLGLFASMKGGSYGDTLFEKDSVLNRITLIEKVLVRNPNLEAAKNAWQASIFEADRVSAYQDPALIGAISPGSISGKRPGYVLRLSQRIPFPGKLGLAGKVAKAKSEEIKGDYDKMRLYLATLASSLFDDYYVTARALEVNSHHIEQLKNLKLLMGNLR